MYRCKASGLAAAVLLAALGGLRPHSAFAHLTGNAAALADCRRRLLDVLMPQQMAANGSFPKELARTKPFGYSIFNLDVMSALAQLLSTPDENLLRYALPDGRSMVLGVEFLAPYIADKNAWPGTQDVMYWDEWPMRMLRSEWELIRQPPAEGLRPYHPADQEQAIHLIQRTFALPDREAARARLRRWWRQIDTELYGYQIDGELLGLAAVTDDAPALLDVVAAAEHQARIAQLLRERNEGNVPEARRVTS